MADEKETKKKTTESNAGDGSEKPKRTRSTSAKKPSAAKDDKPKRTRTAAKPKEGEKPKPARRRAAPKAGGKASGTAEAKAEKTAEAKAEEKPAAKAPARRRRSAPKPAERRAAPAAPVVTARAKYVRSSARKARLVMDHVRGKSIDEARALLRHSRQGVARDVERLLASAIANAENNHELVGDDLYVKEIYADEGPTLKRFRPRAQGRAYRVRKRTSHLTVALTPKE